MARASVEELHQAGQAFAAGAEGESLLRTLCKRHSDDPQLHFLLGAMLERAGFVRVGFRRENPSLGVYETMNPRYTHAPGAWRTRAYSGLVRWVGPAVYRQVQRRGWGDALWCHAHR